MVDEEHCFFHYLLQKLKNHWHIGGDRVYVVVLTPSRENGPSQSIEASGRWGLASARVARGWYGWADWLHKGKTLNRQKKIFALFLKMYVSFCPLSQRSGAIVGPWGSINTLSSAPSSKRGGERHNRGCLRGGPAVARLAAWLFRRISVVPDPRRSWAGVLGASGRGSVVPSVSAVYLADPQEFGTLGRLALV